MTQYGVTALDNGLSLTANCALSWVICLALITVISPLRGPRIEESSSTDEVGLASAGIGPGPGQIVLF